MKSSNNHHRARRAAIAIEAYGDDVPESNLIDFLTDAIHWCEWHEEDFERCLRLARQHHHAETKGEDQEELCRDTK